MTVKTSEIRVGKLDAARRQLRTAITLWFADGDPVSIHALAFAAYEVIHAISKKRDPNRRGLLFDSPAIKEEHRSEVNKLIKRYAYFFKHADRDGDAVIEFSPEINEWLIFYAVIGRELCGETPHDEESTFLWWVQIHHPDILTQEGREAIANLIPVENLEHMRRMSKREFFEAIAEGRRQLGKRLMVRPVVV